MIETILVRKNLSLKMRITVKTLISIGIVALAVVLPQLVHLALGQSGGVQWLSARHLVGTGHRNRLSPRRLFDYLRIRKPYARRGEASLYDG